MVEIVSPRDSSKTYQARSNRIQWTPAVGQEYQARVAPTHGVQQSPACYLWHEASKDYSSPICFFEHDSEYPADLKVNDIIKVRVTKMARAGNFGFGEFVERVKNA